MTSEIILGYSIIYAQDGLIAEMAMQLLPETTNVVLLTDQNMPLMNGSVLIKKIIETGKQIAAIAMHTDMSSDEPAIADIMSLNLKKFHFIQKQDKQDIENFIETYVLETFENSISNEKNSNSASTSLIPIT